MEDEVKTEGEAVAETPAEETLAGEENAVVEGAEATEETPAEAEAPAE